MSRCFKPWNTLAAVLLAALSPYALAQTATKSDIAYGPLKGQVLDYYAPAAQPPVPILLMVHGGAWRIGDKAHGGVVGSKAQYFLAHGFLFVSVDYRMSNVTPLDEAADVARSIRYVQAHGAEWGGDPGRLIVMGHSAGAHLVSLIASNPSQFSVKPWRATIALDSAALNVPLIMQDRHFSFYDDAFGADPKFWAEASPYHQLSNKPGPLLMVCSSQRRNSCPQAEAFVRKAQSLGGDAQVLPVDMTHEQINHDLGLDSDYTAAVDRFIENHLR